MADSMKVCSGCGKARRKDDFRRDSRRQDGRKAQCRACTGRADKARYWDSQAEYWSRVVARLKREREAQNAPEPEPVDVVYDWASHGVTAAEAHQHTNVPLWRPISSWGGQSFRLGRGKLPGDLPPGVVRGHAHREALFIC